MDTPRFGSGGYGRLAIVTLLAAALLPVFDSAALGQGRGRKRGRKEGKDKLHDLLVWGELGKPIRGSEGFYGFTYRKKDKKGKLRKIEAFVKVPEAKKKCVFYKDHRITLKHLKRGDHVRIFGKPVESQVPYRGGAAGGSTGRDYQIQNGQVLLAGELAEFSLDRNYTYPKLPGVVWLEAEVQKTGGGLSVRFKGVNYRVAMAKRSALIKRVKIERKVFAKSKKKRYVFLHADAIKERPETRKRGDADKKSYQAARIMLLDRGFARARSTYHLIWGE